MKVGGKEVRYGKKGSTRLAVQLQKIVFKKKNIKDKTRCKSVDLKKNPFNRLFFFRSQT